MNCEWNQLSSPTCFWSWCFITTIVTLTKTPKHVFYLFVVILFYLFVLRQDLSMLSWLSWNLLCIPGQPWAHRDPPVSISLEAGLKACTTTSGLFFFFKNSFLNYLFYFLCEWIICLYVCLCTMCKPGVRQGQKRVLSGVTDICGFHVGVGNQTQVSVRATSTISPARWPCTWSKWSHWEKREALQYC